jgi:hypothetical protein
MFVQNTYTRTMAIEAFKHLLWKARKDALLSKLSGKTSSLKFFDEVKASNQQGRRYLGVKQIPVEKITGTVGRNRDFDGRMRPLKMHLRDRWVDVAVGSEEAGWTSIEVIKVDDDYYVLNGHHRASVARSTGMIFMDAEVWELSQGSKDAKEQVFCPQAARHAKPAPACGILTQKPAVCC